jgi:hypothetical protein
VDGTARYLGVSTNRHGRLSDGSDHPSR